MSEDLHRLRDECDQLRQRCDEIQRQLNDVTAQVGGMANELGRRFSDAAVNASPPPHGLATPNAIAFLISAD